MRTVGKIFPKPIPEAVSEPAVELDAQTAPEAVSEPAPKPEKEKPWKAPAEKKD